MGNVSSTSSGVVNANPDPAAATVPTGFFARSIRLVQNTFLSSAGSEHQAAPRRLPDITNSNFAAYISHEKVDTEPRRFWGIHFTRQLFASLKQPLIFNGDTFVYCTFERLAFSPEVSELNAQPVKFIRVKFNDCVFRSWANLPKGSEVIDCTFYFSSFRFDSVWRRFRFSDFSHCWAGTTLNGAAGKVGWTASNVSLSDIDMRNGALKNIAFYHPEGVGVVDSNFSGAEFDNVAFRGDSAATGSFYEFINADLSNLKARNLMLQNVRFVDVNLENAKIFNLILYGEVDFSGADFGYYLPGNITLSAAMFRTPSQIDISLNSISNPRSGAHFFNTLRTINSRILQIQLAEQLAIHCSTLPELKAQLRRQPVLVLSVMNGLQEYAADSAIIGVFLNECVLKLGNVVLPTPTPENIGMFQHIAGLITGKDFAMLNRFEYQFLAHQLMFSDPALKSYWYQHPVLRNIIRQSSSIMLIDREDLLEGHFFFSPAGARVLYIAAKDFRELFEFYQIPKAFTHFTYGPVGQIENLPADQPEFNKTLSYFPALHKIWASAGNSLAPVMVTMLAATGELSREQQKRLQEITKHFVSLLSQSITKKMSLTSVRDVTILQAVLARYYAEKEATASRQVLIQDMQTRLSEALTSHGLSDAQQKALVAFVLARLLTSLSSSTYCGEEGDSPLPLRILAFTLLADCRNGWPELVSKANAQSWQETLMPTKSGTFGCTYLLEREMSSFRPSIQSSDEKKKITRLIQRLYPL